MLADVLQLIFLMSSSIGAKVEGAWWNLIRDDLRIIFALGLFFFNLLILAVFIYLAGLVVVGKKRALLSGAIIISLLGTVLSTLFFMFLPYRLLALALSVILWLLLIKRVYGIGWPTAIAVGSLAMVIFLAITVLLALFFGIMEVLIERFPLLFCIF